MPERVGGEGSFKIVKLGREDYDTLAGLWGKSGLNSLRLSGRDSRDCFNAQLECGQLVLGLEIEGELIASVVATHDCRKGWMNHLVVHPEHRRKGYGEAILAEAERLLEEKGFRVIGALVEGPNESSLSLFEKSGYTIHKDIYYLSKRDDAHA
jgi:ribosomal protein S18 acetylase RimI-like enzyme